MIMGTGWREVRGVCIDDDVLINDRELLGSSEITALLSGLRQPEPLGRLKMNEVFLAWNTARIVTITFRRHDMYMK
jgi:hypothetical protein